MNNPRRKIGIDFDDVIYGFNRAYCDFHNAKYGTNIAYEDISQYEMEKTWGISLQECVKRVDEFYFSTDHAGAKPVEGSLRGIGILKRDNDLHLITSRREDVRAQTTSWLEKHFPNTFAEIHFTNQFGSTKKKRLKSEVCKELGIDVMVEDALHYADDLSTKGVRVLLLDTPWNQGQVPELVSRVDSWDEAVEALQGQ